MADCPVGRFDVEQEVVREDPIDPPIERLTFALEAIRGSGDLRQTRRGTVARRLVCEHFARVFRVTIQLCFLYARIREPEAERRRHGEYEHDTDSGLDHRERELPSIGFATPVAPGMPILPGTPISH